MGSNTQTIPKPPGLANRAQATDSDGSQKKRRISAVTDTRQSPSKRSLYAADPDGLTVTPSEQGVEDFHSLTTSAEKFTPFAVPFTPWLSIREGERYCHVRDGTLRAAIKRGDVPAYKRNGGKGVLVHMSDLDAWIRSWNLAKGAFA